MSTAIQSRQTPRWGRLLAGTRSLFWAVASWILEMVDRMLEWALALTYPQVWLRFLFLSAYILFGLVRPYHLHPRPIPPGIPLCPCILLPDADWVRGLRLSLSLTWEWFRFLFRWPIVRYWLWWFGPFFCAWVATAAFLERLFALPRISRGGVEPSLAPKVLYHRAFGPLYRWALVVGQGMVQDENSPLFLVGGPGWLQIGVDSAVVLEKVGRADLRILSPDDVASYRPPLWIRWLQRLYVMPRAAVPMEPYERLRTVLDLRHQFLEFDLHLRTRDGVPLTFSKVRAVYGVDPGHRRPTLARPYPFTSEALRRIALNETGSARPLHHDLPAWQADQPPDYRTVDRMLGIMRTALRTQLKDAVGRRTLQEVLAAIEPPEQTELEQRVLETTGATLVFPTQPPVPEPPANKARRFELSALLRQQPYHLKGIHLYWADMNDWDVPVQGIKPQFLEAWELTRENRLRSDPVALRQVREQAYLSFLLGHFEEWSHTLDPGPEEANTPLLDRLRRWLASVRALLLTWLERVEEAVSFDESSPGPRGPQGAPRDSDAPPHGHAASPREPRAVRLRRLVRLLGHLLQEDAKGRETGPRHAP